ncbi:MAG TPA: hypothetical protein VI942_05055, partial [Thermoanaerobaculia bacterium]|nr:hypothetical protein [Thermoanaerobaculia bacterium]
MRSALRRATLWLTGLTLPLLASAGSAGATDSLPSPRTEFRSVETPSFQIVGDVSARRLTELGERLET